MSVTDIPGPSHTEFAYNLLRARGNRLFLMNRLVDRYGDIVKIKSSGVETIILANPADARDVLVTNHADYIRVNYPAWLYKLFSTGLIPAEKNKHRELRKPVQHYFNAKQLREHVNQMIIAVDDLCADWQPGKSLNFTDEMMKITLSNVCECLLGKKPRYELDLLRKSFQVLHNEFSKTRWIDPTLSKYLNKLPFPGNIKLHNAFRYINSITDKWIADARFDEAHFDNSLLGRLTHAVTTSESDNLDSSVDIAGTLKIFLSAGTETTASTLSSVWLLLSQHPDELLRLRAEIDNVIGHRSLEYDDLDKLELLDRIIRETLRLYPPVTGVSRETNRDVTIGGYEVQRGRRIVISPWNMHRQEHIYKQANDFLPDRWCNISRSSIQSKAWNPFGLGARRCVAEQFAMLEMKIVIVTVLRRWHICVAKKCRPKLETSMSMWLVRNLPVTLKKV